MKDQATQRISATHKKGKPLRQVAHILVTILFFGLVSMPAKAVDAFLSVGYGKVSLDDEGGDFAANLSTSWLYGLGALSLGPEIDLIATEDDGFYIGINALGRVFIFDSVFITIASGVGWHHEGTVFALGHPINFKQSLGLGYAFDNGMTLGISASHFSNAGLSDHNPGANAVMLKLSYPLSAKPQ